MLSQKRATLTLWLFVQQFLTSATGTRTSTGSCR
uniref:Uncharacterized protein n=1 Tax=Arundo donax TaxID=35708 RepID=A0A0A9DZV9_ARUDO